MSATPDRYELNADQVAIYEVLADEIHRHALLGTVPTHADIERWAHQFTLVDYEWRQVVQHHECLAKSPPPPRLHLVKSASLPSGEDR